MLRRPLLFTVESDNATNAGERELFAKLFTNYVPEVRPRIDPTQNVAVTVDLYLNHIKQMVLYTLSHDNNNNNNNNFISQRNIHVVDGRLPGRPEPIYAGRL